MSIPQVIIRIRINLIQSLPALLLGSLLLCSPAIGQESRSPEGRSSEGRSSEGRSSEGRSSETVSTEKVSAVYRAKEPSRKSIQKISDAIDRLVESKLSDDGLKRNKRAGDSVFLRRVYLDLSLIHI